MKKIFLLLVFSLSIKITAQFSLENFINEPIKDTLTSAKEKYADKKFKLNVEGTFDIISYFDWLEPVSIKVNLMFKKDGKQISKSISNAKESEEDAQKLFDIVSTALIHKFGESLFKKSLFGTTAYSWSGPGGSVITLAQKSDKTVLMIMIYK